MAIGNYIRNLRTARGLSQEELGKMVGVQRAAVQKWESGKTTNLKRETIKKLAEFFGVSPAAFIAESIKPSEIDESHIHVPVYGYIPAGIPMEAIEDILGYEDIPADWARGNKSFFALKIKGDSMYPNYLDGDVIIFEKTETAESGKDVAVFISNMEATFKRLERTLDGITIRPLNPSYPPRTFTNSEIISLPVRILGVARELRRQTL